MARNENVTIVRETVEAALASRVLFALLCVSAFMTNSARGCVYVSLRATAAAFLQLDDTPLRSECVLAARN